jgi:peptidoglycan/LPS O-acetylase OafA/YrhL
MENKVKYFPALDGFRFFAFMLVFFQHTTFYIKPELVNPILYKFFNNNGWVGVDIFFALSGFLVTYLFLLEREEHKYFSFKNFWIRRALRIMPLYYLAIVVGYFAAPFLYNLIFNIQIPNLEKTISTYLPWHMVFLGNWAEARFGWESLRGVSQLWAISVDQQFYLIWPLVLLLTRSFKSSIFASLLFITFAIVFRFYLVSTTTNHPGIYTNTFARMDTFAFGAIIAQVLFFKPEIFKKIKALFSLPALIILTISFILFLYYSSLDNRLAVRNGVWGYTFVGIFSSYYILYFLEDRSTLVKLFSNKILTYLGKISYGLYIWHILSLEILFYLIKDPKINLLIPFIGLPLTIFFAVITFHFFELPFLNIKKKFKKV